MKKVRNGSINKLIKLPDVNHVHTYLICNSSATQYQFRECKTAAAIWTKNNPCLLHNIFFFFREVSIIFCSILYLCGSYGVPSISRIYDKVRPQFTAQLLYNAATSRSGFIFTVPLQPLQSNPSFVGCFIYCFTFASMHGLQSRANLYLLFNMQTFIHILSSSAFSIY